MSAGRARVLIFFRAPEGGEGVIEAAYHKISQELMGTPGMLSNELLEELEDPQSFVVLSEWASVDAFKEWEQGPRHRGTTSPMRQYQDRELGRKHYGVFRVAAAYEAQPA